MLVRLKSKRKNQSGKAGGKLLPPRIRSRGKAQRRYIPEKAAYRDRLFDGGGNLLKLAR